MTWEEIPFLKYEAELLVRCGAWKSIFEIEDSLTLEELFLLYRASVNETSMDMKIAAATQGADVDFNEDWYDPSSEPEEPAGGSEIVSMPFGLGYQQIAKE